MNKTTLKVVACLGLAKIIMGAFKIKLLEENIIFNVTFTLVLFIIMFGLVKIFKKKKVENERT